MFSTETLERLLKVIPHNELYSSPIKGLFLRHSDQPFCYEGIIQEPSICIVLSGEREIQLGEQCYRFDNYHFMFCLSMCRCAVRLNIQSRKSRLRFGRYGTLRPCKGLCNAQSGAARYAHRASGRTPKPTAEAASVRFSARYVRRCRFPVVFNHLPNAEKLLAGQIAVRCQQRRRQAGLLQQGKRCNAHCLQGLPKIRDTLILFIFLPAF